MTSHVRSGRRRAADEMDDRYFAQFIATNCSVPILEQRSNFQHTHHRGLWNRTALFLHAGRPLRLAVLTFWAKKKELGSTRSAYNISRHRYLISTDETRTVLIGDDLRIWIEQFNQYWSNTTLDVAIYRRSNDIFLWSCFVTFLDGACSCTIKN